MKDFKTAVAEEAPQQGGLAIGERVVVRCLRAAQALGADRGTAEHVELNVRGLNVENRWRERSKVEEKQLWIYT